MAYLKIGLLVAVMLAFSWLYGSRASALADAATARKDLADYRAQVNAKALERMENHNRDALIRARNNERIADADFKRNEALRKRVAVAERAARGLRDTIADLERRPVPEDPDARAYAHEASAARSLLGRCTEEYRSMDQRAQELGNQVIGLQEYVTGVCASGNDAPTNPDDL